MRNSRPPGPPSTLSSNSGQGLVYGTHRPRGPQHSFTPESTEQVPTKKKTRLIVILGVALPVLACIIGIAAWAVTTDVLRITPRANDNSYNRFGPQGKTRIDDLQSRSDQDVDVFVLHGITPSTSTSPTTSTKKTSSTIMSTTKSSVSTSSTMNTPKASDILSKLISDVNAPRNPKNFVVFAPIPEEGNSENQRKGRRLDRKVVFHDGDDLVAEESVISEDTSQELGSEKGSFNKQQKPTPGNSLKLRMGMPIHRKMNEKVKSERNPRILPDHASESPPNFIKRPQQGEFVAFPPNPKSSANLISNRKGGNTVPNNNFQRNNFPSPQQNTVFQKNIKIDHQSSRGLHQPFENAHSVSSNPSYQSSGFQPSAPSLFSNKENTPQFQMIHPQGVQNNENNIPLQHYQRENQRSPSFKKHQIIESSPSHFSPVQGPPQTNFPSSLQNTFSKDNLSPSPSYSNTPQKSFSSDNSPLSPNFSGSVQNNFSPETSPMNSGGPQYFAPPPQTFHTKINYDQPHTKFSPPSSMATYEKVAQSSIDQTANDGAHHHHHHHHHHEPVPSNSEPIGDVNYSDVPRANDADRLGSIGIGLGPSRGITVQIGGGGGGLGGLLPLGTLGIAKNIISALLPRPSLGLNSKVFLGVEVGKGSGFSIG